MTEHASGAAPSPSAVLARAAGVAGGAPSIQNTQPWRWRIDGASMRLYVEPTRQLLATDPGGRLMVLSCGAALQYARTALAAQGWRVTVDRVAGADRPQLMAELTLLGRTAPIAAATGMLGTIHSRHNAPRPTADGSIRPPDLDAIRAVVEAERTGLQVLHPDDGVGLAVAADHAGDLPDGDDGDGPAVYAILFGADDSPQAWLQAGEALSAAQLTADALGVSVRSTGEAAEAGITRQTLRRLGGIGEPLLMLRFAVADPGHTGLPGPRGGASDQVVEIVGEARARAAVNLAVTPKQADPGRTGPPVLIRT